MIQPDGNSDNLSSEMRVDDQKRLSRRSAFKKAIQGGVALYVAPQILCSELVRAQGVVSGGPVGGGGGEFIPVGEGGPVDGDSNGGGDWWPLAFAPFVAAGAPPVLKGASPVTAAIPPVASGTTAAGVGPGGVGSGGVGRRPSPRATLPPKPLKRRNKSPKRAIKGLW